MTRFINISIITVVLTALLFPLSINAEENVTKEQIKEAVSKALNSIDTISTSKVVIEYPDYDKSDTNYSDNAISENIVELSAIVFGITVPFATIVIIVFLIVSFMLKKRRLHYHAIELAITNGRELPDSFYDNFNKFKSKSRLQSSLVWISWGIGIFFILYFSNDIESASLGIIPLLVGISKLITYLVEDRKKTQKDAE